MKVISIMYQLIREENTRHVGWTSVIKNNLRGLTSTHWFTISFVGSQCIYLISFRQDDLCQLGFVMETKLVEIYKNKHS